LKSPEAMALARPPTLTGEPASCANPPPGCRSRIVTLPLTKFATARSLRPSPLKSATVE
jgi:hypothetical protein